MKLKRMTRALSIAPLLFAFCSSPALADDVLATVNGKPIYQSDLDTYLNHNDVGNQGNERVLEELIAREIVKQDAEKKGLDKSKAMQAELRWSRAQVLLNAAVEAELDANPITDADIKALYDQEVKNFNATEYKARHILLDSEGKAKEMINKLDNGADFAELAKEHSTGPSGPEGGDLGWFAPQQMVPPFSAAVSKLSKGGYTRNPVKTQFGYHVIKLDDTRTPAPPSMEQVRPQLEKALKQQRIARYLESLKNAADVEKK